MIDALPAAAPSIRRSLRDTALEVSLLAQRGEISDIASLRRHCLGLVANFEQDLDDQGLSAEVREDMLYAQCALLDEAVLTRLAPDDKAQWDAEPLQVIKFSDHDAGNKLFDRVERAMRDPEPDVDLLRGYATVLGLGFKGRYALGGETERRVLIAQLNALIEKHDPMEAPDFVVRSGGGGRLARFFARLSPWAIAGLAALVVLVLYLAFDASLDAELARLIAQAK